MILTGAMDARAVAGLRDRFRGACKVPTRAARPDRRAGLWAASEELVWPHLEQAAGRTQGSETA